MPENRKFNAEQAYDVDYFVATVSGKILSFFKKSRVKL